MATFTLTLTHAEGSDLLMALAIREKCMREIAASTTLPSDAAYFIEQADRASALYARVRDALAAMEGV